MKKFILSLTFFGSILISSGLLAQLPTVAIVASDNALLMDDVQSKLINTGFFEVVDIIDVNSATPTLTTLQGYDAIFTYTQVPASDPTLLGDNLAAYIEGGGGVVAAWASNIEGFQIGGSFETNYQLLGTTTNNFSGVQFSMIIDDASHPLMAGVSDFNGGTSSYYSGSAPILNGGNVVASWSNGEPLVVVADDIGPASTRRVDLNFWPASSDALADLWDSSTDGDLIMANALLWVIDDCPTADPDWDMGMPGAATINDGSYEFDYISNKNCGILIEPAGAIQITLNFTSIETESGFDIVTVYNGPDNFSPVLGSFSGSVLLGELTLPGPLVSSGGSMYIEFITDASVNYEGWDANYGTTFSTIGVIGTGSPIGGTVTDVDMAQPDPFGEPHVWTANMNLNSGTVKFRAGDDWITNWGDEYFPFGRGAQGGLDIPVTTGNYNIWFNDQTGEYRFTETGFASTILSELTGGSDKRWTLAQSGLALGVGPYAGSFDWWSFGEGGSSTLQDRPCAGDDSFTFNNDGSLDFYSNNTIFLDAEPSGWNDALGGNQCHDESESGLFVAYDASDVSAFANGGAYTFNYDAVSGALTILGDGHYIGYTAINNDSNITPFPASSKEYVISSLGGGTMQLILPVDGGETYWTFNLVEDRTTSNYPFNANAIDESGNGNDLDVFGPGLANDRFTNGARAYSYDGIDDYMSVFAEIVPSSGDYSVSAWAKSANTNAFAHFLAQNDDSFNAFYLGHNNLGHIRVGDQWEDTGIAFPSDGLWHHIVVTKTDLDTELYVDNILMATLGSALQNPSSFSPEFKVGEVHTGGEYWSGSIDDIKVFDIALNSTEVNDLYIEGGWPTPPPEPGGLLSYATSSSSIDLQWDDVENETGYFIERSEDDVSFSFLTGLGANSTTFTDTGLSENTLYYYRLIAENTVNDSPAALTENATFSTTLSTSFNYNDIYSGVDNDYSEGIAADDQGNYYIVGRYYDQIEFKGNFLNSANPNTLNSVFLTKFDVDGNVFWARSVDPDDHIVPRDVIVAIDGSVYVTGYFWGNIIFAGSTISSTPETFSVYVLKYDTNGNEIWARTINSPSFSVGRTLGSDSNGNIYIGGRLPTEGATFAGTTVTEPGAMVLKYDQFGNEIWIAHAPVATSAGENLVTDIISIDIDDNGIYVTGDLYGTTNFGNGVTATVGEEGDLFVAKYDFNGNAQWVQSGGGTEYELGRDITLDANGNIYVIGEFYSSSFDAPGISLVNNGTGNADIVMLKYDQDGNLLWGQSHGNYPNDYAYSITNNGDNVYVTGYKSKRPVSFGGISVDNGSLWLAKYLSDGTVEWVEKVEGEIWGYELDYFNGRVYMTGNFRHYANFGSFQVQANGFRDIHVATINVGAGGGSAITEYSNNFNTSSGDFIGDFTIETPTGFNDGALHSSHPYTEGVDGNNADFISQLKFPITLNASNAIMTFDEIVLVENGDPGAVFGQTGFWDYVIVEGSRDDGLTWLPFLDGYDCRADADWETLYTTTLDGENSTGQGSPDLFRGRIINLIGNGNFSGGEDVLIRFRLNSDDFAVGWGWAIDNLNIQLSSAPLVTLQSPPSSYEIGTGGVTITANVTDDDVLDAVLFAYGKISEITDDFDQSQYNVIFPEEISQGVYEHRLMDSDFDDVGVQYYFGAIDLAGNVGLSSPLPATVSVAFPDGSINLSDVSPISNSGDPQETDYRIFSVPVRSTTLANVLGNPGVDKKQWRAWRYSGSNSELTSSSSLSAGNGYWLIYQSTAGLSLNVGGVAVDASNSNPFTINLNSGINLIGNPFRFTISWQEVLDHNIAQGIINPADVSGLTFYRGGFNSAGNADLQVTEGAFVQSNEAFTIEIPISSNAFARTGNNARTSRNSLDEDNWEVGIDLANEATFYNVAAVGMNSEAEEGRDKFDQMAMPFLFRYLEFNSANEEFINERVSKDVVKTTENYVWEFEAATSFDPSEASLSWDNSYFGDNDRQLFLYDLKDERIINMREQTEYHFFLRDKQNFKILYGSPEFIESTLKPGSFTLGHAYPNPFADLTRIPFSLSAENDLYKVRLMVYNSIGELINVLVEDDYQSGFYAVEWDGTNEFGQQVSEGIYIYKLRITHKNGSDELTGKLIYRN